MAVPAVKARVPGLAGAWLAVLTLVVACGSEPASPTDAALDVRPDGAGMSSEVASATGGAAPAGTGGSSPVPGAGGAPAGGNGGSGPGPIPGGGGTGGAPIVGGGTTGGSTGSGVDVQTGEDAGSAPDAPPPPGLSATPPQANFGFVTFGHVGAPIDVTVSNPHPTLATGVLGAAITGPDAADFNASSTCTASLAPGAICKITVVFATTVFGPKNATLLVTSDASGPAFATLAVPLTGNGHQADLGISPEAADFGALAYGASKTTTFTITNQGKGRLSGLVATLRGFAGFTLAGSCPDSLAVSESCAALAVTFTSNGQAYTSGELIITARGADDPVATAQLSGTGLGARLRINPSSLAVKARVGETKVVTLAVENYGTAADKPSVTLVNANAAAPFKLASDPCSTAMLAPGRSCNVTLTYRATTTETARASLRAVAPGTAAQALLTGSLP